MSTMEYTHTHTHPVKALLFLESRSALSSLVGRRPELVDHTSHFLLDFFLCVRARDLPHVRSSFERQNERHGAGRDQVLVETLNPKP